MAIDLKSLNHKQLAELIEKAEQRKLEVARESIAKAREKILALLKAEGLTLDELFGSARKGKVRRPAALKYRNPADASQTWSGRGKRPRWFLAAIKAGKKEQDLLIK
ncbi:MAG: H-NS histone family protein [Rudaea sp.]|uniref:H-NS histone family protein n=1 Tax=unclassified Rudaea TaxID=2627037 RepID=UPI0010F879B6|nr:MULTISPECIES: H-NS histone family protein [unclassified Rudaea]MBN8888011.1 H-NS histone family protein [Rudaea sp.]MBR0346517.1 H-NS histone family protein [Rudaea sp.]